MVVLGGGLGGLETVRRLGTTDARVTLIDRAETQVFQPLLPLVASGQVAPHAAERSLARAVSGFRRGEVASIDKANKWVSLRDGSRVSYDYLVVATGATSNLRADWAPHVQPLRTLEDAVGIRTRMGEAFSAAERELDPARRQQMLTFTIIGGGPTGVELAGSLAEMTAALLPKFPHLSARDVSLVLVQGGDRLLPSFSQPASDYARRELEARNVKVLVRTKVDAVSAGQVQLSGRTIACDNVFWAAGTAGAAKTFDLAVPDERGRVPVADDLSLRGHPDIFVIGDAAAPRGQVPSVAAAAIQGGAHVASAIKADIAGRARTPFRYFDKGAAVQIANGAAIVETPFARFTGRAAAASVAGLHVLFAPDSSFSGRASLLGAMAGLSPREGMPRVDNRFSAAEHGELTTAGGLIAQIRQATITAGLSAAAAQGLNGGAADFLARSSLWTLSPSPPLAGYPAMRHDYASVIPDRTPLEVFDLACRNLERAFGASGLTVRGAGSGWPRKMMLEDAGTPRVWLPIRAEVDRSTRTLSIVTLDGHGLRGTNTFAFTSDGGSGTRIVQTTFTQGSSQLIRVGQALSAEARQAETWREFHAFLFRVAQPR